MSSAQELFEPGEYIPTHGPGYFTIGARPGGIWAQASYPVTNLPVVVNGLNPAIDTYITQATFRTRSRLAVNVNTVGLMFADLDTYHVPALVMKSPEDQAELLVVFCADQGIPAPSIVLFSGQGLQAKWLLTESLGQLSLPEWNQAQLGLVKLLEPFAADLAARDVSRVLRVDRTVNTKSGKVCRVVYVTGGAEGCPARYDFQELRALLVGEMIAQAPREDRRRAADRPPLAMPREWSFKRLNWTRLQDLRALWAARGGVPEGFRELTLFHELNCLLRADPGRSCHIWKEAEALAAEIAPGTGFYRDSDLGTLYRKAQASLKGELVTFHGREYPALYTPRNQTLLDLFRITPAEERALRTIISHEERLRRYREKAWAAGVKPRPDLSSRPWEALGISRAWWYRTVRKAGE